jgi:hypothetical protein
MFRGYRLRPEEVVATEVATYLYDVNRRLVEKFPATHTVSNLAWQVLEDSWGERLEDSPEKVQDDIRGLFALIHDKLPTLVGAQGEDLYAELDEQQTRALVDNMLGQGIDIAALNTLKTSGEFLRLVDEETVVDMFRRHPETFFDGGIWDIGYANIEGLEPGIVEEVQARFRASYLNCLEDCASFLRYRAPEPIITFRARASVDFLTQKLA